MYLPYDSEVSLLVIYLKETKTLGPGGGAPG